MRTVTETYNVYIYPELSEEAKEKVNQWYLDDPTRSDMFYETYMEELREFFPHSDLKMQYSLASCQGDGVNIYGNLDLTDVLNVICDRLSFGTMFCPYWDDMTEHEIKTIEAYINACAMDIVLPYNSHYCYCMVDKTDFAEEWVEELKYQRYKNIQVDTIRKMEGIVISIFSMLARKYEDDGYNYFYETDEEEITEACETNGWEFLEDGTFYVA